MGHAVVAIGRRELRLRTLILSVHTPAARRLGLQDVGHAVVATGRREL